MCAMQGGKTNLNSTESELKNALTGSEASSGQENEEEAKFNEVEAERR